MLRGQTSSDYIIGLGLIMALATGIMLPALKNDEISIALASARISALDYVLANSSLVLDSLTYNVSSNNTIFISPTVFYNNTRVYSQGLRASMAQSISQTLSLGGTGLNSTSDCAAGLFNDFCVVN